MNAPGLSWRRGGLLSSLLLGLYACAASHAPMAPAERAVVAAATAPAAPPPSEAVEEGDPLVLREIEVPR
ncbi:MAG: hypothetical protein RMJ98_21130, partial [Myxococcales bacterium]|nr:hypothetical protein [Polyangiaceae bacterium]MDW8251808.1 hypothetical protein [Myxococcales bacterium]